MKERPILFSAPMVRAILKGRKTQTRRLLKVQPDAVHDSRPYWNIGGYRAWEFTNESDIMRMGTHNPLRCPYGQPGDRLWVRETFTVEHQVESDQYPPHSDGRPVHQCQHGSGWRQAHYRATDPAPELQYEDMSADCEPECRWKPSIHMPRWASRILLEIVSVRVERLHDISVEEAKAEGVIGKEEAAESGLPWHDNPRRAFSFLWKRIHGDESWLSNPWVWVIEFRKVTP